MRNDKRLKKTLKQRFMSHLNIQGEKIQRIADANFIWGLNKSYY